MTHPCTTTRPTPQFPRNQLVRVRAWLAVAAMDLFNHYYMDIIEVRMAKNRTIGRARMEAHRRMHGATNQGSQPPRLVSNGDIVMTKPTEDANRDLGKDIAEAVGKTIGNIVNRIEALDKERDELVATLA